MTAHFEPLRPNRSGITAERYEFAHGKNSLCVYDIDTLDFVKEIPVGTHPDCHATSPDNRYLYLACFEGLYCIDQEKLEVVKVVDTGRLYATNVLPDNETLLVHDVCGGVVVIDDMTDMERIHVRKRVQVIPNGVFRCEIGGKGHFTRDGEHYLCCGWLQDKLYLFDMKDFSFETFVDTDPRLHASDDLVISRDKTKAYCACHMPKERNSFVTVVNIPGRRILKTIETGRGTCGLTMTGDERYVIASNDKDDSVSVIDTETDQVVNTPCAREGFEKLGMPGSCIQGISCGRDDSVYVYECSGYGAIVRFFDVTKSNRYVVSCPKGKYISD